MVVEDYVQDVTFTEVPNSQPARYDADAQGRLIELHMSEDMRKEVSSKNKARAVLSQTQQPVLEHEVAVTPYGAGDSITPFLLDDSLYKTSDTDSEALHAWLSDVVRDITLYRRKRMRIRATSNNPESSRSHLFLTFKLTFQDGRTSYLTAVDMAGRESAADFYSSFVTLYEKPASQAQLAIRTKLQGHVPTTYDATYAFLNSLRRDRQVRGFMQNFLIKPKEKAEAARASRLSAAERDAAQLSKTPYDVFIDALLYWLRKAIATEYKETDKDTSVDGWPVIVVVKQASKQASYRIVPILPYDNNMGDPYDTAIKNAAKSLAAAAFGITRETKNIAAVYNERKATLKGDKNQKCAALKEMIRNPAKAYVATFENTHPPADKTPQRTVMLQMLRVYRQLWDRLPTNDKFVLADTDFDTISSSVFTGSEFSQCTSLFDLDIVEDDNTRAAQLATVKETIEDLSTNAYDPNELIAEIKSAFMSFVEKYQIDVDAPEEDMVIMDKVTQKARDPDNGARMLVENLVTINSGRGNKLAADPSSLLTQYFGNGFKAHTDAKDPVRHQLRTETVRSFYNVQEKATPAAYMRSILSLGVMAAECYYITKSLSNLEKFLLARQSPEQPAWNNPTAQMLSFLADDMPNKSTIKPTKFVMFCALKDDECMTQGAGRRVQAQDAAMQALEFADKITSEKLQQLAAVKPNNASEGNHTPNRRR
jgi:hypothetical protein